MKTTLEPPEKELRDAMRFSKAKTKRAAIAAAVADFNRRHRMAELIKYSGASDTFSTNQEIEST